jgi:UDP-N-acetylmuramoylalanine--D-glutamate ligase
LTPRPPLPPGPYLIVGLARSGVAAARALRARGERVIGLDRAISAGAELLGVRQGGSIERDGAAAARELAEAGMELCPEGDGLTLLERVRTVVKSPGVPAQAPVVAAARERGMTVVGELELAWRMLPNELIAVTGTNGKTTTVELIAHVHRQAGLPVAAAGNIGTALSSLVGQAEPQVTVVCEVSSFQLEDTLAFAPEAAVLLNLAPDHLDRHGSFERYTAAKLQIFARQTPKDIAVIPFAVDLPQAEGMTAVPSPVDLPQAEGMTAVPLPVDLPEAEGATAVSSPVDLPEAEDMAGVPSRPGRPEGWGQARRIAFGGEGHAGLSLRDGQLCWQGGALMPAEEVRLRGAHNLQNAMAAAAVCLARGLPAEAVAAGLRSFPGVPHRLEEIATLDGVLYVNDSKATNVASTLVALDAMASDGLPVHLILGGLGKGQDFAPLAPSVARDCRAAYLIGQDAPLIARALSSADVPMSQCGDLERAVAEARAAARAGDVVLLSPACASFDQFADFEARGERFRELVAGIRPRASK